MTARRNTGYPRRLPGITVWTLEPEDSSLPERLWIEADSIEGAIPDKIINWLEQNGYTFDPGKLEVGNGMVLLNRVWDAEDGHRILTGDPA